MSQQPLILVTNDDGIYAPGITALAKIASRFGKIVVVAPDKPQSGMGHAITINSTLRIQPTTYHNAEIEFSCTGTPVDCVKMAINHVLKRKPDMILSGINHGSNSSINVIYSGTMSAAIEGALEGVPSIGFSLCDYAMEADFLQAELMGDELIADEPDHVEHVGRARSPERDSPHDHDPVAARGEMMAQGHALRLADHFLEAGNVARVNRVHAPIDAHASRGDL